MNSQSRTPGFLGAFLILNALSATALWHSPLFFWLPSTPDRVLSWLLAMAFLARRFGVQRRDVFDHIRRHIDLYAMAALFAAAWSVRRIGLYFGLPFCYGVDESYVVDAAIRMIKTGEFNPQRFHYPSLGFYITAAALVRGFLHDAGQGLWNSLSAVPDYVFYYPARWVSAVFSAATAPALYLLGRRIAGRGAALLGAGLLAVSHLSSESARNAGFHGMAPLLVVASLIVLLESLERASRWWILAAAALAGLAFSTMYYSITLLPLIIAGAWLRTPGWRRIGDSLMCGIVFALSFLAATPYALLDLPNFVNQFSERLALSVSRGNIGLGGTGGITAMNYARGYLAAFGVVAAVLFIGGLFAALLRLERTRLLLYAFAVLHLTFMGSYRAAYGRYLGPFEPIYLLLAADACIRVISWARARLRTAFWVASAGLLIPALFIAPVRRQFQWYEHARAPLSCEAARKWIAEHLSPDALYLRERRTPPLPQGYANTRSLDRIVDLPVDECLSSGARYLILSQSDETWNSEENRRYVWYVRRLGARLLVTFQGNDNIQNPTVVIYEVPEAPRGPSP